MFNIVKSPGLCWMFVLWLFWRRWLLSLWPLNIFWWVYLCFVFVGSLFFLWKSLSLHKEHEGSKEPTWMWASGRLHNQHGDARRVLCILYEADVLHSLFVPWCALHGHCWEALVSRALFVDEKSNINANLSINAFLCPLNEHCASIKEGQWQVLFIPHLWKWAAVYWSRVFICSCGLIKLAWSV